MTESAFLDALVAEPDDDAHRLVFADWLDDHGDPTWAEFIRTQVALETMDEAEPTESLMATSCQWRKGYIRSSRTCGSRSRCGDPGSPGQFTPDRRSTHS